MSTRSRASRLRIDVQCAQRAVEDSLGFCEQSRGNFMTAVRESNTDALDQLVQRLEADEEILRQRMAELQDSYEKMRRLDDQLLREDGHEAEPLEYNYMQNLSETGQITYANYDDNESEPEMPVLLREYFDAIGDLRLMQERLEDELPYEHAEQKLRRQQLMDQDEVLSQTEEEFEEKCLNEVNVVHHKIKDLTTRVSQLHAEVEQAGLNPDPTQFQRESPSGSVVDWLDSVAATVDLSPETPVETQPLPPADWLDNVATPIVDLSFEQLEQVQSLPDSTTMPNPEILAPHFKPPVWDDRQYELENNAFHSPSPHADLNVAPATQHHGPNSFSPMTEGTEGVPERSTTQSNQELQKDTRTEDAEPQCGVLLKIEPMRHGSLDTSTSGGSMENLGAVIDGDSSVQHDPFSSGSIKATVYHKPDTSQGAQLTREAQNFDGGEEGFDCDHEDVLLFTFTGIAMLQRQQQDFFVRGVVFETSLADTMQIEPFPTQAIARESRTTLMVFKRNAKDCVACPIFPSHRYESSNAWSDMSVTYVPAKGTASSGPFDNHQDRNLRVKTWLSGISTGQRMRMTLTATVPISYNAKVRHIGNLEQKSLFDLIQILDEYEKSKYSIRLR